MATTYHRIFTLFLHRISVFLENFYNEIVTLVHQAVQPALLSDGGFFLPYRAWD
jgi:hypothetical protein